MSSKTKAAGEAADVVTKMFNAAGSGIKSAVNYLGSPMMETAQDMSKKKIGIKQALKQRYYKAKEGRAKYHNVDDKFYKFENGDYVFDKNTNKVMEADPSDIEFQYGKLLGDTLKTGTLASGAFGAAKGVLTDDNEKFNLPGIPFI